MKTPRKLETIAAGLTVPERVLLFCVASSTSPTFPTGALILEFCRQNASRINGR